MKKLMTFTALFAAALAWADSAQIEDITVRFGEISASRIAPGSDSNALASASAHVAITNGDPHGVLPQAAFQASAMLSSWTSTGGITRWYAPNGTDWMERNANVLTERTITNNVWVLGGSVVIPLPYPISAFSSASWSVLINAGPVYTIQGIIGGNVYSTVFGSSSISNTSFTLSYSGQTTNINYYAVFTNSQNWILSTQRVSEAIANAWPYVPYGNSVYAGTRTNTIDAISHNGFYQLDGGGGTAPIFGHAFFVLHNNDNSSTNSASQFAIDATADNGCYIRRKVSGAWSVWYQMGGSSGLTTNDVDARVALGVATRPTYAETTNAAAAVVAAGGYATSNNAALYGVPTLNGTNLCEICPQWVPLVFGQLTSGSFGYMPSGLNTYATFLSTGNSNRFALIQNPYPYNDSIVRAYVYAPATATPSFTVGTVWQVDTVPGGAWTNQVVCPTGYAPPTPITFFVPAGGTNGSAAKCYFLRVWLPNFPNDNINVLNPMVRKATETESALWNAGTWNPTNSWR